MNYLFCSVHDQAVAFPLPEVSLLKDDESIDNHEVVNILVEQLGKSDKAASTIAAAFVGDAKLNRAWRVDRPLCLCEVPNERMRNIPSTLVRGLPWANGVIAAGASLHHQLLTYPTAWIIHMGLKITTAAIEDGTVNSSTIPATEFSR